MTLSPCHRRGRRRWQRIIGLTAAGWLLTIAAATRVECATVVKLVPSFTLSEFGTDNLLFATSNRQADAITNLGLGFSLMADNPSRTGSLSYRTLSQIFAVHPRYDSYFQSHDLVMTELENLSPRTGLAFSDGLFIGNLSSATSLLAQAAAGGAPTGLSPQTELGAANTQTTESNYFSASLNHALSESWSMTTGVGQSFTTSGTTGMNLYQSGNLGADHKFSNQLSIEMHYSFNDFRSTGPGGTPPSQYNYFQFQANWQPTQHLTLQGGAGPIVTHVSGSNGGVSADAGYLGSVSYQGERWQLTVSGSQTPGLGLQGSGLRRSAGANLNYLLTRYSTLFAYANYFQFPGSINSSDNVIYGLGVSSQVTRWLVLSAQYMGVQETVLEGSPAAGSGTSTRSITANDLIVSATISFEALRFAL